MLWAIGKEGMGSGKNMIVWHMVMWYGYVGVRSVFIIVIFSKYTSNGEMVRFMVTGEGFN